MSLLARYRAMPEKARLGSTAVIGAFIGLLTYELVYFFMPLAPRATLSWIAAFIVGVARQHGLHRWLTYSERDSPYWVSLGRAYVMYSGALVIGASLDWTLTEKVGMHHRLAWVCCLVTTATISLFFLKRFVFVEKRPGPCSGSPPA